MQTALGNGGFYADIKEAFGKAETLFTTGAVAAKLEQTLQVTAPVSTTDLSLKASSVVVHC